MQKRDGGIRLVEERICPKNNTDKQAFTIFASPRHAEMFLLVTKSASWETAVISSYLESKPLDLIGKISFTQVSHTLVLFLDKFRY